MNDQSADFAACFAREFPRVVRSLVLAGFSEVQAQDVAQDAFLEALRRWPRISRGPNPAGYVYRVAYRRAFRKPRFRGHNVSLDAVKLESTPVDVATDIAVDQAIRLLPERRRKVAVMTFVLGFSSAETAHALGISDATVRKHAELARRDLRAQLGESVTDFVE